MDEAKILDHGYLKLIDVWGSDERIVEAARMSTQKGFLGWGGDPCPKCREAGRLSESDGLFKTYADSELAREAKCACGGKGKTVGDEKLLGYLYENKHATPFEFAGLVIEVQAPIFVFREWHRHRTQSYNEMSARYAPLPDLNYVPTIERLLVNSKTNRQAGTIAGSDALTEESAKQFQDALGVMYVEAQRLYEGALRCGVPKELARVHLPVGRYSRMRASTCLRNWLAFLTLRSAPTAQYEIRVYADALGALIAARFPRTWSLFTDERNRSRFA